MLYILTFLATEFLISGGNFTKMLTNITDYILLPFRAFYLVFINTQKAEFNYKHFSASRQNSIPGRILKLLIDLR